MTTQNGMVGSFSPTPPPGVKLDPKDPRTWWMANATAVTDRYPLTAQMHDHSMTLAGVPAQRFYDEAETNVKVGAAVAAYYGLDSPQAIGEMYNSEAEAMGQKMIRGEHSMPTIDFREPLINERGDLLKLKPPDWLASSRVRYTLDVIKLGTAMGLTSGLFCAPFSLAVGIRSYPKLIRDMKKDPKFAQDLFTCLVDEIVPSYLKVEKEYSGVSMATGSDAWAAYPNLSPEMMEEWVVPYARRLAQNCQQFGMVVEFYGGGDYCEERPEKFDRDILYKCLDVQTKLFGGKPALFLLMGRWHEYPLQPVAEYLSRYKEKGVRATILAAVNARLLRDGPIAKIVDNIKRYIDVLGRDHDLLLSLANIPADTPSEHVHAAVAAARAYGRLPIAENLDEVDFHLPKRESFQDYLKVMSNGAGLSI